MEKHLCESCIKADVCLVPGYITDAQKRLLKIPYWHDFQISCDFIAKITKCPMYKEDYDG